MRTLNCEVPELLLPQVEYLLSIGVTPEDLYKVTTRELSPTGTTKKILHRPDLIKSKVEFYQSEFNLDGSTIGKMIVRAVDGLFTRNIDDIREKLKVLYRLGLDKYTVAKLLSNSSGLFSLKLDTLEDKILCLRESISNLESNDKLNALVLKIVSIKPSTLTRKSEKISESLDVLSQYGFTQEELVAMIQKNPNILMYDIRSINRKFEFLKEKGFEQDQTRAFFSSAPKLFDLSVEKNLGPTLKFLMETGWSIPNLSAFPTVLNYSLHNRIKPRYHFLRKKLPNYDPSQSFQWIVRPDSDFAKKIVKCSLEEWLAYRKSTNFEAL